MEVTKRKVSLKLNSVFNGSRKSDAKRTHFEEIVWMSVGDQGHPLTKAPSDLCCWTVFKEAQFSLCLLHFHYTGEHPHNPMVRTGTDEDIYMVESECVCASNVHQGTNQTSLHTAKSYLLITFSLWSFV